MTNPQVDPEVKRLTGIMRQYAEGKEIPMSLPDVALALIEMGPDTPGWEESLRALIHSDGYYHDRKGPFPDISTKFWACYCLARYRLSADLVVPELLNQSAHTVELFIHNPTDPFSGIMNAIMGVRILCLYLNKIDQIPEALDAIFRRAINNTSCHYIEPYIALILAKSGHRAPSIAHALILHKTYQTRWDQDHINTSSDPFYPVFDEYEVFYNHCQPVLMERYPEYDFYEQLLMAFFIQTGDKYKHAILKEMATCKKSQAALNFIIGTAHDPDPAIRMATCVALRRISSEEQNGEFKWTPKSSIDSRVKDTLEMLRWDKETEVRLFSHYCMYKLNLIDIQHVQQILSEGLTDPADHNVRIAQDMVQSLSGQDERNREFSLMCLSYTRSY